jgi:SOS response regulatory protein OraA/RecX
MHLEIISFGAGPCDDIYVCFALGEGKNSEKRRFLVPNSFYVDLSLQKGECSQELFDAVERESEVHAAYKKALSVIGFGACSERRLISKLVEKGFAKEVALAAVARAAENRIICEDDNAIREAEISASKLWGVVRIRAHLCAKGYSSEAIDAAMFSLEDNGIDFSENCVKLIKSKYRTLPRDRGELSKLVASMQRYGYSIGEIKAALGTISNEKRSIYD